MDLLQLRKEIDYIFETGANGIRIFNLFKNTLQRQWHPMETAPKDAAILICDERQDIYIGRWLYDDWMETGDKDYVIISPIGWQPLPKPMKVK